MRLPEESVVVACPNPKCRREIEEPILLTNLSVTPPEQYDACPYCFSKLDPNTANQDETNALEEDEDPNFQVLKKVEDLILSSNGPQEKEKETSGCPEDFGYLANRPENVPIPPECMLCPKMVDCMLKTKK